MFYRESLKIDVVKLLWPIKIGPEVIPVLFTPVIPWPPVQIKTLANKHKPIQIEEKYIN